MRDINITYISCCLCGSVYFNSNNTNENCQCRVCNDKEYVEDLCATMPLCGECYINYLYKMPYVLIQGANKIRTERISKNVITCLYRFNEDYQIRFENYVYNEYCTRDVPKKKLIRELKNVSGIPVFMIKDIILAMRNIKEGFV